MISIVFQLCQLFLTLLTLSSATLGLSLSFSFSSFLLFSGKSGDAIDDEITTLIYPIPVLSVIYHLINHCRCLFLTTQQFTHSSFSATLGLFCHFTLSLCLS